MPLYRTLRVRDILSAAEALNNRWDRDLALTRLDTLGIPLRRRAGKLSGGQQTQVALTLALARRTACRPAAAAGCPACRAGSAPGRGPTCCSALRPH